MKIIYSNLFKSFPEITFGFSTKIGLDRSEPYFFNLSHTVGDIERIVNENREAFAKNLGLNISQIAFQKQIHSDKITIVNEAGVIGESDAMITDKKNIGLSISSADCTPIFIYDSKNKVIAGVHSGWRGTQNQILTKTINLLITKFKADPNNLFVYFGPSITQMNYEVGKEVADLFDLKYIVQNDGRLYLNVIKANEDQLKLFGIPSSQIEISNLCSFQEKDLLHSYRRDGSRSGRAHGIIALKN